jgi:hypothetical protein
MSVGLGDSIHITSYSDSSITVSESKCRLVDLLLFGVLKAEKTFIQCAPLYLLTYVITTYNFPAETSVRLRVENWSFGFAYVRIRECVQRGFSCIYPDT